MMMFEIGSQCPPIIHPALMDGDFHFMVLVGIILFTPSKSPPVNMGRPVNVSPNGKCLSPLLRLRSKGLGIGVNQPCASL